MQYLNENVRHRNSVAKSVEDAYHALRARTEEYFSKLEAPRQGNEERRQTDRVIKAFESE